ncbi:MAG TPA: ABC transporter ATP-binding protein [Burkholderiaceae bacterium]|nr:ABC transporter ATP-binding protein [Burkholderiaceae bacterium]
MITIAEWRKVTKRYGSVTAVQDVTLELEPGEATALVGHNGAGKTTLIKLLLGLIRPDEGSVRVAGVDPAGARGAEARRALGFLPENVAFHGAMTGTELLAFYARLKRQPLANNRELLERVGLSHAADRRVSTYSKGMRQRLGIAQALIGVPKLLLFDEPTSGLDPASRADVYELIDTLRKGGATVLVSTHALAEIEQHVDRVAIMHRSRLIAAGTLAELRRGAEADARLRVRVVPCSTGRVLKQLPENVRCVQRSESELVLMMPARLKMDVLRVLLAMPEIVLDVEVTAPGLQQLYGQLVDTVEDPA